jgi:DnaJ-class molecular chaperone
MPLSMRALGVRPRTVIAFDPDWWQLCGRCSGIGVEPTITTMGPSEACAWCEGDGVRRKGIPYW